MTDQLSGPVADLAFVALDHAAESIRSGGPLIPFVVTESGGERSIERCVADTLEASLDQARQTAHSRLPACDRLAIAFDGFITFEGARTDAVYVHAFERGQSQGPQLALRYKRAGLLRKNKPVGNPIMLGVFPLDE